MTLPLSIRDLQVRAKGRVLLSVPKLDLPAGSLGFVYLPALGIILLASVLAAPLGAHLAHRLPIKVLKRVFAGLLLVLSAKMLWSLYGT